MYKLETYLQEINTLANNLIYKSSAVAVQMNEHVAYVTGSVPSDNKHTWKYYLNLSGTKHSTNSDVKITLLEDNTTVSLTKDVVNLNKTTRKELRRFSTYTRDLFNSYPDDILYIMGCIYDIDINTAIEAAEGVILAYPTSYVEPREISFIREIQDHIQGYLYRWDVIDYSITDELYNTATYLNIQTMLPGTIFNIRLNNTNTYQTHSFFIEHKLRSTLDIYEEAKTLKDEYIFKLYKNVDYIAANVGKDSTLKYILEEILNPNNVGVGNYTITTTLPTDNNNTTNLEEATYISTDNVLHARALNDSYDNSAAETLNIKDLVKLELSETGTYSDYEDIATSIVDAEYDKTNNTIGDNNITKVLDINIIKIFKMYGNDPVISVLDHWLYFIKNNMFSMLGEFVDPNTAVTYSLTPEQGYKVMLYMLLKVVGLENTTIQQLNYGKVIDTTLTKVDLLQNLFNQSQTEPLADTIINNTPNAISVITNVDTFKTYHSELEDLYTKLWLIDSNVNNGVQSSNVKYMARKLCKSGSYNITDVPKSIVDILAESGVVLSMSSDYNYYESFLAVIKTFTGVTIDNYGEIKELLDNYTSLLTKVTSYTLKTIKTGNDLNSLYVPYSTIEAYRPDEGIIAVLDAEITKALEDNNSVLHTEGNDFVDSGRAVDRVVTPTSDVVNIDFQGAATIYNGNIGGKPTLPTSYVSIESMVPIRRPRYILTTDSYTDVSELSGIAATSDINLDNIVTDDGHVSFGGSGTLYNGNIGGKPTVPTSYVSTTQMTPVRRPLYKLATDSYTDVSEISGIAATSDINLDNIIMGDNAITTYIGEPTPEVDIGWVERPAATVTIEDV